jgi:hypothetical protein
MLIESRPDIQLDKPALRQLYAYWDGKRAGRPYPARDDIDPLELKFILGCLLLLDVESGPPQRFRYRLFGSEIARHQGIDMTGKYTDEHPWQEFAAKIGGVYSGLVATARPCVVRRRQMIDDRYFDHQSLVLPLGRGKVDMILVGVIFAPSDTATP